MRNGDPRAMHVASCIEAARWIFETGGFCLTENVLEIEGLTDPKSVVGLDEKPVHTACRRPPASPTAPGSAQLWRPFRLRCSGIL
jgi:hypothetical protein